MERKEAIDLIISALVLAFVFAYQGIGKLEVIVSLLPISLVAVSMGFLLHELAHRYFAKKYGVHAEYKMWKFGIMLALIFTLVSNGSFVFAAPGAVMIYPRMDLWGNVKHLSNKKYGIVSLAGPITNIILGSIFVLFGILVSPSVGFFAASVNFWLAIFNLLPIMPLDGSKVWSWDRRIWVIAFAISIALFGLLLFL